MCPWINYKFCVVFRASEKVMEGQTRPKRKLEYPIAIAGIRLTGSDFLLQFLLQQRLETSSRIRASLF